MSIQTYADEALLNQLSVNVAI